MDKEIQIHKNSGKIRQNEKGERVIQMDDLTEANEFSKDELVGMVNLSLNQYIQDWVSLEIQLRALKEVADMLRGKEKTEEAFGKIAEIKAIQENKAQQIKFHRQVREELRDGRLTV